MDCRDLHQIAFKTKLQQLPTQAYTKLAHRTDLRKLAQGLVIHNGNVLSILYASHQQALRHCKIESALVLAVERIQSQQASERQQYAYEQPPQTAEQKKENQVLQGVEGGCSKCEARVKPVKAKQLD